MFTELINDVDDVDIPISVYNIDDQALGKLKNEYLISGRHRFLNLIEKNYTKLNDLCNDYQYVKADMENGDNINPGRLNQMINLIEAMFKSHKTEQILGFYKNQQPSESNTEIDFDELLIEEFLEMLE